jgi:DNA-directed RNA polymerase specialized sigma24 family protein
MKRIRKTNRKFTNQYAPGTPRIEPQTWRAFWHTVVLGQTTAEVAESLGMTRPAVRKAKSRTLHRLRQQLGDAD